MRISLVRVLGMHKDPWIITPPTLKYYALSEWMSGIQFDSPLHGALCLSFAQPTRNCCFTQPPSVAFLMGLSIGVLFPPQDPQHNHFPSAGRLTFPRVLRRRSSLSGVRTFLWWCFSKYLRAFLGVNRKLFLRSVNKPLETEGHVIIFPKDV